MLKPDLNIAFIGNYSPRLCGIATFTTDLCEAIATQLGRRSNVFAVAVNDTEQGYAYPAAGGIHHAKEPAERLL